jgi:hypothetical protein
MVDSSVSICDNPITEEILTVTVVSTAIATSAIIAAAIVGCLVFAVIMVLSDDKHRSSLARLSGYSWVYLVPLLIMFVYIVLIWGAKILTR